jgi:hypothetical protein
MVQSVWRLDYGLDYRGFGVRFAVVARDLFVLHNVQTGFGAHATSYTMGTMGCFTGGKEAVTSI